MKNRALPLEILNKYIYIYYTSIYTNTSREFNISLYQVGYFEDHFFLFSQPTWVKHMNSLGIFCQASHGFSSKLLLWSATTKATWLARLRASNLAAHLDFGSRFDRWEGSVVANRPSPIIGRKVMPLRTTTYSLIVLVWGLYAPPTTTTFKPGTRNNHWFDVRFFVTFLVW